MENKKRLIDATPDDCIRKVKRKTNFAKIIVSGTAVRPYYEIMWFDYMDREYHIGYGSYNIHFVFQWLSECFEIEDAPTVDAVEIQKYEALVEMYHELRENFIDYVCSGVRNEAPYCLNKCEDCVDSRGWCKLEICHGFNPAEVILDEERREG